MLLLCDLDGTLVDRDAAFRAWCVDLAGRHEQGDDFVDWLISEDRGGAWDRRDLFGLVRARLDLEASLDELSVQFMREFTSRFRCVEGAVEALARVKAAGHRVAIVTNGGGTQMDKVSAAGLDEMADAICVSSIENCWKPDPRLLRIAAERAEADLDGAWMIGDSRADIEAAFAAGIDSVWLHHGYQWQEASFRPTAEASCFPDAVAAVLHDWSPRLES